MKSFLVAFLLVFAGCHVAFAKSDTPKAKRAYLAQVEPLLKATKPTIARFHAMLEQEKELQRQLARKTISVQEYRNRAAKPADWLAIIPKVRVASHKFSLIRPVPPSMRAAQLNFVRFAQCTDQGLNNLKNWVYKRRQSDLATAFDDLNSAFLFLDRATTISNMA